MPNLTIKDIARVSGCSVSTISRVINDRPDVRPETKEHVLKVMREAGFVPNTNARQLKIQQSRSVVFVVKGTRNLFFSDFPELTEAEKEVMAGETVPTVLEAFKAKLEAMSDDEFVAENIFPQIKAVQKETGIKGKNLFMPIRIAVSGEMHGPELPDTIYLLGREKSIQHIESMLEKITK